MTSRPDPATWVSFTLPRWTRDICCRSLAITTVDHSTVVLWWLLILRDPAVGVVTSEHRSLAASQPDLACSSYTVVTESRAVQDRDDERHSRCHCHAVCFCRIEKVLILYSERTAAVLDTKHELTNSMRWERIQGSRKLPLVRPARGLADCSAPAPECISLSSPLCAFKKKQKKSNARSDFPKEQGKTECHNGRRPPAQGEIPKSTMNQRTPQIAISMQVWIVFEQMK